MSEKNKKKEPVTGKPQSGTIKFPINVTWPIWLCVVGIVAITFLVFSASLKNDFVNWDDQDYVTENPLVVNDHIPVKDIFLTTISNHYHPFTMLSLALNYQTAQLNPKVYHETNLLLHLLNTALVFFFIYLLSRKNILMASIVALFFGIHPMHVESVAWISERKDVLYSFFFLAGLITYLHYIETKKTAWYIITFVLFIFSCMSKSMAIVFPVILLAIDYYVGNRSFYQVLKSKSLVSKIPFFIFSIVFAATGYFTQLKADPVNFEQYPVIDRAMFACYGAIMYPVKFFAPVNLSSFYPYPAMENVLSSMLIFPLLLFAIAVLIYFFLRREKALLFGLVFYFTCVVLVLQFITVGAELISERYSYMSYIGLLFIVAYYINECWTKKDTVLARLKYPLSALLVVAAIFFCFQTYARTRVWENGETLWTDVMTKYPKQFISYANRGEYYQSVGEEEKALTDFNTCLQLNPKYSEASYNRARIHYKNGNYTLALADYNSTIANNTDSSQSSSYYMGRALTLMRLNENTKAENDLHEAFLYEKYTARAKQILLLVNRAFYYDQTRQFEKAIVDYTSYLQSKPDDDLIFNSRGLCEIKLNKINEAYADFNKAIELKADVPNYWLNRSVTENALGKNEQARADAIKARQLGMHVDPVYLKALGLM